SETDPLSEASFDSSVDAAELITALGTSSLLGGRRLVIVSDAQDLKKDQIAALESYLESPSPDSVLVLISSGRSKLDAMVKQAGAIVTLDAPRGRRLVGWLRDRAKAHALKLDERAAWAMIDSVGTELRDLDTAMTQLSTELGSGARIGAAEVRSAFGRLADERIFAFTDAVGDRRLPLAMTALRRLLDQGDEPLMVFGALSSLFRRLLRARRYADQGSKAVGDVLGVAGWRAERIQKQARMYREEELVQAIQILAATDVELKGGDMPADAALERAVTQIVMGSQTALL
ncbi:MAG: polymerase subunit delta, partial [Actinomycetota bacterium]|nr:polymerase subunit delta [Actinomycetota bacterium]